MKKLSFITILFLCVFVCISSAHAIPVIYSIQGSIVDIDSDPFGWGGQQFSLTLTIDSNKSPYSLEEGVNYKHTTYVPDTSAFYIGTQAQVAEDSYIKYSKYMGSYDSTGVSLRNGTEGWEFNFSAFYEYCYLGEEYPIRIRENLTDEDSSSGGGFIASTSTPSLLYDLSIDQFGARAVPEPATMLLLGSGFVGLSGFGRKRFKR